MSKTEEDVQYLIQIVKKDIQIQERRRFLDDAPSKIKAIDKELKKMDEELEEGRERLERLEKERRHLEREIQDANDKINRKREEQRNVKTNKEYRAINTEIDYLTKIVDRDEERILAILDEVESIKNNLKEIEEKVNREKKELLAEKEALQKGMEESEEALKIMEDEKVRILPHISEPVRKLYQRILNVKGDSGVANLVGDICQGCYSRIPPQTAHEVRKNNQIITCEVCGRILVYYPLEESK